MTEKQNLKAVIFDMDGVILDSERTLLEVWKMIAEEYSLQGITEAYISVCGTTHEKTGQVMRSVYGEDFPFEQLDARAYATRDIIYKDGLPLKTGIRELLHTLREYGIQIALATSTDRKRAFSQLEAVDLLQYFDVRVTGDMVHRSKPDPEIFNIAIELLQIAPEEAMIIEDSFNGIRAAAQTGAQAIMVPDLKQPDAQILQLCTKVFPTLLEVREYVIQRMQCTGKENVPC